jgi:hypothetical protein
VLLYGCRCRACKAFSELMMTQQAEGVQSRGVKVVEKVVEGRTCWFDGVLHSSLHQRR